MTNETHHQPDIFHLIQESLWNTCNESQTPYKPPTYEADGGFIHATKEPTLLLDVGNHFYKTDPSNYLLLRIDPNKLQNAIVKYEAPAAVGDTEAESKEEDEVLFPHIYGLLNLDSVIKVYKVIRDDDGSFVDIEGFDMER